MGGVWETSGCTRAAGYRQRDAGGGRGHTGPRRRSSEGGFVCLAFMLHDLGIEVCPDIYASSEGTLGQGRVMSWSLLSYTRCAVATFIAIIVTDLFGSSMMRPELVERELVPVSTYKEFASSHPCMLCNWLDPLFRLTCDHVTRRTGDARIRHRYCISQC